MESRLPVPENSKPILRPFIPVWLDDAGLSASEFRVLCHLWRRADKDGFAWPGQREISRACKIKLNTVGRVLKTLENGGYFSVIKGKGTTPSKYSLAAKYETNGDTSDYNGITQDNEQRINLDNASTPCDYKEVTQPTPNSDYKEVTQDGLALSQKIPSDYNGITNGITKKVNHRDRYISQPSLELEIQQKPKRDLRVEAETIYQSYPRKAARGKAIDAIGRCLKTVSFEDLLEKTKQYASAVSKWSEDQRQFIPHGATWFSQQRYLDDPQTWERRPSTAKPSYREIRCSTLGTDEVLDSF